MPISIIERKNRDIGRNGHSHHLFDSEGRRKRKYLKQSLKQKGQELNPEVAA